MDNYIRNHFSDIKKYADVIEKRIYDDCDFEELLQDNAQRLSLCKKYGVNHILIDDEYTIDEI